MQKVFQRTAAAKRQAKRKAQIFSKKVAHVEQKQFRQEMFEHLKLLRQNVKQARITRREDWELGPLAPRRDAGLEAETYGTMAANAVMLPSKPASMKPKNFHLAIGDRVVITKGLDQGKIGVIREIREEGEFAFVDGLRLTDLGIPKWQRKADGDPRQYRTLEAPVHMDNLKLIHALQDPVTGVKRDVVVEKFQLRSNGTPEKERIIPGTSVVIPWPPKNEPEAAKNDDDTTVASLEERTWVPELLTSPLPAGVIDELRNPYSRFRERHDDEYVERKMAEDQRDEFFKNPERNHMRTPIQELRALKKMEEAIEGPRPLTNEVLVRIGEAMAANGGRKGKKALKA